MTSERLSAILSIVAALVIVVASFFTMFDEGFGRLLPRRWVKYMLGVVTALLVAALGLLVFGD